MNWHRHDQDHNEWANNKVNKGCEEQVEPAQGSAVCPVVEDRTFQDRKKLVWVAFVVSVLHHFHKVYFFVLVSIHDPVNQGDWERDGVKQGCDQSGIRVLDDEREDLISANPCGERVVEQVPKHLGHWEVFCRLE